MLSRHADKNVISINAPDTLIVAQNARGRGKSVTTIPEEQRTAPNGLSLVNTGTIWLFLAFAAGIYVFWNGLVSLGDAWSTPEYSHGPLIPILSSYLFLRQLRERGIDPRPVAGRWVGILVVIAGLAIAAIGDLARIPDIVTYALLIWLYGLLLVGFGFKNGWVYWPPVLHLIYMLPLPNFIYWQVSIQLQFVSSELGVWFIRLMNIPVYLDGNIIDLGIYKLHVAEACSGLRYLFPVMSFSYVFAVLYRCPIWIKAVLLLSAAPITVVMNSFRIGVIGVLVDSYGIEQAEGFLHYFEGWVIFILCILILFGLARLMQFAVGDRRPIAEALDLSYEGIWPQVSKVFSMRRSLAIVLTGLLVAGAAIGWSVVPDRGSVIVKRDPLVLFPSQLGGWRSGVPDRLTPEIEAVLGADDYYSVNFVNPKFKAPVSFFVAYYEKQTEGAGIHSPEVCIPAGGWEMSRIKRMEIPLETAVAKTTVGTVPVNRAVIQKGLSKQVVYYWFEGRGRRVTNDYIAKALTLFDAITRSRTDGALVRLLTPVRPGETEAQAEERLKAFLDESVDVFGRFITA